MPPSNAFGLHRVSSPELTRLLRALHRGVLPSPITRSALIEKAFGHIEGHLDLLVGRDVASAKALVVAVLGERSADSGQSQIRLAYCGSPTPGTRSRDMLEQVRELLASTRQRAVLYGLRARGAGELLSTVRALSAGRDAALQLVFCGDNLHDPVAEVRSWLLPRLSPCAGLEVFVVSAMRLRVRAVVVDNERVLVTSGELDAREEDGCLDVGATFGDRAYAQTLAAEWDRLVSAGMCARIEL